MTPAVNVLQKHAITHTLHSYEHDPNMPAFGDEATEKLGLPAHQVFKTLVVSTDKQQLAVAVVPVSAQLSMKRMAAALGVKRVEMADKALVARSTGYVLGGVSPLGQKKHLTTVIDDSARQMTTIFISGGRRGLEIELSPESLSTLLSADFMPISA